MAEVTQNPNPANPTVDSPGGQAAATEPEGQQTAQPSTIPIDDYKNIQAAFTRSQQELKALKEQVSQRDHDFEEKLAKTKEYEETVTRLRQAFQPETVETQLNPEQVAELDRLFQQTPTYKSFSEQTKAQQQQQEATRARQHEVAVNEAAVALEQKYKLDADTGNKLKDYIQARPHLLFGVQSALTKEQAQLAFEDSYKAFHYDTLQQNAVKLGTQQVEQNLKAMEAASSVEKPSQKAGTTEAAGITYVPGHGLDGVWDQVSARVRQEHGL